MPDKDGKRPEVEVWHLAGGAMWNNKMDNIMMIDRPEWWQDKKSTWARIKTHKIKRRRTGGTAGEQVDYLYLPKKASYCIKDTDEEVLDKVRIGHYKADKDYYLNELRRYEKMGLQNRLIEYVEDEQPEETTKVTKIIFSNPEDMMGFKPSDIEPF